MGWMRTAFSARLVEDGFFRWLNEDGLFSWVGWGRLFQMGWMGTAFSAGLVGDGFFRWVGWGRLFQMGWMGTAFSAGLVGDGFFRWVEWGRLLAPFPPLVGNYLTNWHIISSTRFVYFKKTRRQNHLDVISNRDLQMIEYHSDYEEIWLVESIWTDTGKRVWQDMFICIIKIGS